MTRTGNEHVRLRTAAAVWQAFDGEMVALDVHAGTGDVEAFVDSLASRSLLED